MTMSKAAPVLVLCVVFDGMRLFFNWFWLLGPAVAAGACATFDYQIVQAACVAGVAAIGFYGSAVLIAFGTIMALAVAVAGWLIVSLVVVSTNFRLLRENAQAALLSLVGLGTSLVPFIGALPALTGTAWHLYRTQIKHDKKKLQAWEAANAARIKQERDAQVQQVLAMRARAQEEAEEEEIPEYEYEEAA